jgi:hypothetical protein
MNRRITCYWAMLHEVPSGYWLKQAKKYKKKMYRVSREWFN